MGIHDRDYYRNDGRSLFDGVGRWGVTVWLIVVTCGAFLVQLLTIDAAGGGLTAVGHYHLQDIRRGEVWRLVAPVFLHPPGGLLALAFNMFTLFWCGRRMEEVYGGRRVLLFYLAAGVLGLVLTFLGQLAGLLVPTPPPGAGPAVTAVLVLFACHYPRETLSLFGILPVPAWAVACLFVGLSLYMGGAGVFVYLVAAAFGFVYYRTGRFADPGWWPPRPRAARRPQLRVVRPEPPDDDPDEDPAPRVTAPAPRPAAPPGDEHLEARLDDVLEKVSRFGQQSLTPEEREILFRASELYKRRRK